MTDPDPERRDMTQYRPLAWILLVSLALWAIYFIALPKWAVATAAVLLGVLTSLVFGIEIRAFIQRRIEHRERAQRTAFQEELDEIDRRLDDAS